MSEERGGSSEARAVFRNVAAYLIERNQLHSADLETVRSYAMAALRVRTLEAEENPNDAQILAWGRRMELLATALMLNPSARAKADKAVRKGTVNGDAGVPRTQWGQKLQAVRGGKR